MKRIVILGAGESGAGAAVLAKKEGFDVFVSDMSASSRSDSEHTAIYISVCISGFAKFS